MIKLSKSYYDLHAILILIVFRGLTLNMGNLPLSLINISTDSRCLRTCGNVVAKVTIVFSLLALFSSCSIPVLSALQDNFASQHAGEIIEWFGLTIEESSHVMKNITKSLDSMFHY